jgi:predicted O-methyltransferase YrrM
MVHAMDFSTDPEIGLWSTDRDCYELLARECRDGVRTLETGAGLSTALFAALGALHTCVTPSQLEADRVVAYCREREISVASLLFAIGASDDVLPRLTRPVDLFLIDGNHGFPTPILDWYYGARLLVDGGLLVIDDTQLPAVNELRRFIDHDARWTQVRRSSKWAAWRRLGSGSLCQDWFEQPSYAVPLPLHRRLVGKVRHEYARRRGH